MTVLFAGASRLEDGDGAATYGESPARRSYRRRGGAPVAVILLLVGISAWKIT